MPKRREDIHEDQRRRALRDLDRLNQQSDASGRWTTDVTAESGDDAAERWGKLIGRGLGILFLVYLLYYLSQKLL